MTLENKNIPFQLALYYKWFMNLHIKRGDILYIYEISKTISFAYHLKKSL